MGAVEQLEVRTLLAAAIDLGLRHVQLTLPDVDNPASQIAEDYFADKLCAGSFDTHASAMTRQLNSNANTAAMDVHAVTDTQRRDEVLAAATWDWLCEDDESDVDGDETEAETKSTNSSDFNTIGNAPTHSSGIVPQPQDLVGDIDASLRPGTTDRALQATMIPLVAPSIPSSARLLSEPVAIDSLQTFDASANTFHYFSAAENFDPPAQPSLASDALGNYIVHDTFMTMSLLKPNSDRSEVSNDTSNEHLAKRNASPSEELARHDRVRPQRPFAGDQLSSAVLFATFASKDAEPSWDSSVELIEQRARSASQVAIVSDSKHEGPGLAATFTETSRIETRRIQSNWPKQKMGLCLLTLTSVMLTVQQRWYGHSLDHSSEWAKLSGALSRKNFRLASRGK